MWPPCCTHLASQGSFCLAPVVWKVNTDFPALSEHHRLGVCIFELVRAGPNLSYAAVALVIAPVWNFTFLFAKLKEYKNLCCFHKKCASPLELQSLSQLLFWFNHVFAAPVFTFVADSAVTLHVLSLSAMTWMFCFPVCVAYIKLMVPFLCDPSMNKTWPAFGPCQLQQDRVVYFRAILSPQL